MMRKSEFHSTSKPHTWPAAAKCLLWHEDMENVTPPPKATLNKWHSGKCDENLLESYSEPKHHHYQISGSNAKAASLSPLPLSVWLALVSDESLSWPYSAGSHVTLSHRSLPRGSHRKSVFPGHLNCPAVQRGKKGRVVKSRTLNLGALFFLTVIRLWAKLQYSTFLLLMTVADAVVAIKFLCQSAF